MYVGLTVRLGQIVNASAVTVVLSVLGVPAMIISFFVNLSRGKAYEEPQAVSLTRL